MRDDPEIVELRIRYLGTTDTQSNRGDKESIIYLMTQTLNDEVKAYGSEVIKRMKGKE